MFPFKLQHDVIPPWFTGIGRCAQFTEHIDYYFNKNIALARKQNLQSVLKL